MAAMPNAKTMIKGVKFFMIALGVSLFKLKGVCAVYGLTAAEGLYRAFVSRSAYQFVHPGKQVSTVRRVESTQ